MFTNSVHRPDICIGSKTKENPVPVMIEHIRRLSDEKQIRTGQIYLLAYQVQDPRKG